MGAVEGSALERGVEVWGAFGRKPEAIWFCKNLLLSYR
jgi:hypothetical protein